MVRLNCLNACREVEDDINAGVRRTRMEWGCPTVTGSQVCDEAFDGDDLLAGRCPDGGFKMVEATSFEAGHGT